MQISKSLIVSFLAILAIFSCSVPDEDDSSSPQDSIQSADGLRIELEWSTGGSVNQSTDDADLDLILSKDGNIVEESNYWFSFESVEIESIYADGDYYLDVYVNNIQQDATYTLYVSGINESETLSYTGSLSSVDDEITIQYLKIIKNGNRYTIVDL